MEKESSASPTSFRKDRNRPRLMKKSSASDRCRSSSDLQTIDHSATCNPSPDAGGDGSKTQRVESRGEPGARGVPKGNKDGFHADTGNALWLLPSWPAVGLSAPTAGQAATLAHGPSRHAPP